METARFLRLAIKIAHEVNQPLAAIVANSEACHRWLSTEPPNLERARITVEYITRDAHSAADVVSRIRALFRHAPQHRSRDEISRVIGEVRRVMADEIAANGIGMDTELEPDLPTAAFDRVQIQQVLVNLIRNGIEAMDGVADHRRSHRCFYAPNDGQRFAVSSLEEMGAEDSSRAREAPSSA